MTGVEGLQGVLLVLRDSGDQAAGWAHRSKGSSELSELQDPLLPECGLGRDQVPDILLDPIFIHKGTLHTLFCVHTS